MSTGTRAQVAKSGGAGQQADGDQSTVPEIENSNLRKENEELRKELRQLQTQLSALLTTSANTTENVARETPVNLGYKIRPDTYDGTTSFREYLVQFLLIADASEWNSAPKGIALAGALRGKARSVLEGISHLDFEELKMKLELRFESAYSFQNCYSLLVANKQASDESLTELGAEIEKLVRLAYPDVPLETRDRIAVGQFINALSNQRTRETLQIEGACTLATAVARAQIIETIRRREFNYKNAERPREAGRSSGSGRPAKNMENKKECWECGSSEHLRYDCPKLLETNRGN